MPLTAAQVEARAKSLGGSDAAIYTGIKEGAVELFEKLTGRQPRYNDAYSPIRARMGHAMEPLARELLTEATGIRFLEPPPTTFRHPRLPFMVAHPDGLSVEGKKGCELKFRTAHRKMEWGPTGTDQAATDAFMQSYHCMSVLELEEWRISVLFDDGEFRHYTLLRDGELIQYIEGAATKFMELVNAGTYPTPINLAEVRLAYPKDVGTAVIATPEILAKVEELRSTAASIKELESEAEGLKFSLQSFMGSNAELLAPGGGLLATWKHNKQSKKVDLDLLRSKYPDAAEACSKPADGARPLLLKKPKKL